MSRAPGYDPDREAYEKGTWFVAVLLGLAGFGVLVGAPLLAESIHRSETTTSRLAALAVGSLVAATASTLVHGIWRLVGIALATAPLLAVVAAYANSA